MRQCLTWIMAAGVLCAAALGADEPWQQLYKGEEATGKHVIALWQFLPGAEKADSSGNGHTLTLRGDSRFADDGKFGSCLESFHSERPHGAMVRNHRNLTPKGAFTLEMWIRPKPELFQEKRVYLLDKQYYVRAGDPAANKDYALTLRALGNGRHVIEASLGFGKDAAQYVSGEVALKAGEWSHILFKYDGAGLGSFFFNGAGYGSTLRKGRGAVAGGTFPLVIGARVGSSHIGFPGFIDQVRITGEPTAALPTRNTAARRGVYPKTALVSGGKAAAVIVYPHGRPDYEAMAQRIRATVKEAAGVVLETMPDTAVTEKRHPVLLDEYRSRNLILLGRVGINRAIWGVYNRFLCAVDGYYPGGDGYVVRTASNVYSNGANSIILGGSSDAGAARAAEKFIARLKAQPVEQGTLNIPWLLEVELGGQCKQIFDADESRQMARAFPDGGPARRFYENIMSYYWSGRKSYLELGLRYLDYTLTYAETERTETNIPAFGHYSDEFFVRAYNMIDDSGILDADKIQKVDSILLDLFTVNYEQKEVRYRKPIETLSTGLAISDHDSAMWSSDKVLCDFILQKMDVPAAIRSRAQYRRSLVVNAFDMLLANRWQGCSLGQPYTDVPTTAMFRHALEMERYDMFFESGNARRAALYHLIRAENTRGRDIATQWGATSGVSHFKLYLSMCAGYYGDGEFKWIVENMAGGWTTTHFRRYVNRVHLYFPGDEVPSVKPSGSLTGAVSVPLQPVTYSRLKAAGASGLFGKSAVKYPDTFDFAAIRSDYTPKGDHILLGGTARDGFPYSNAILRLTSRGQHYLGHSTSKLYYFQNALDIQDTKEWKTDGILPRMAKLSGISSTKETAFIHSTVEDYSGMNWTRNVVWLGQGKFAVIDEVEALRDGEFMVSANWHALQDAVIKGSDWEVGRDPLVVASAGAVEMRQEDGRTLSQKTLFRMRRGESGAIANFLYVKDGPADRGYEVRKAGAKSLMAVSGKGAHYYIGAPDIGWLDTDGRMAAVSEDFLAVSGARHLRVFGAEMMSAEKPMGVWIRFSTGEMVVSPADRQGGGAVRIKGGAAVSVTKQETVFSLDREETAQFSDKIQGFLRGKWAELPAPVDAAVAERTGPSQRTLERVWTSDVVLRPGLVRSVSKPDALTYDFGKVIDLAEVRIYWGKLPDKIYYGVDRPGKGVAGMELLRGTRTPWDTPLMRNYGQILFKKAAGECLAMDKPVRARYVRTSAEATLHFFDAGAPEPRVRVRVELMDLDGKGTPGVFVRPDIWPGTMGTDRSEHEVWVLNEDGSLRFNVPVHWRMLNAQPLQWDGSGRHHIFICSLDGYVYVYDPDGKFVKKFTLAGTKDLLSGPTPSVIGLWQPDETGKRRVVVGRYHWCGFFDRNLEFMGHGYTKGFWTVNALPKGVDFTGDGIEDTIVMTRYMLRFIDGKRTDRMETGINVYTPMRMQHAVKFLALPAGAESPMRRYKSQLGGARTFIFDMVDEGLPGPERRFIVVRENMVGIAHPGTRSWVFTWVPLSPITAASYWQGAPNLTGREVRLVLTTADGLLRIFNFDTEGKLADYHSQRAPSFAEKIFAGRKAFVLATGSGLYSYDSKGKLELLHAGKYVDVVLLKNKTDGEDLIAVRDDGIIERLKWR